MPAVPSGVVTFLFTDIAGSTARWEQHPAAMRAALARHDAILHDGITAHDGGVIVERGEGDSFFAVFARPTDAVAAACALQGALAAEPWPQEVAPLRVRMALHTGEAELWEGRDYRGATVNRCARLRAVAHGGQIVLSGATQVLVGDHLPPAVTLRDLGEHRLKDLTRPEHIFQVVQPGLAADFPPLKTLDRQRHNLPVQPTALIGRDREVVAVRERLLTPDTRLLTLMGAGGSGKTRLALQVAADVLDAFADGVFFVNLAPIADVALVLPTIAQTLGLVESGAHTLRETLHAFLHDKHLLLLLDNVEQVLEAAVDVADLLAACAGVRVLATSRAALHLRGERRYAVPPLSLPPSDPTPPVGVLAQYDAVRLFVERAQDVSPDFALTDATAPAVAEICVRLDGLPLALELAAARVRLFPPPALLRRLAHRLDVLTGGARDLPERQRTLRAAVDWSYGLLSPQEQALFARLAVFVGGRTWEAIEAICNHDGTLDVLSGIEALVEQSLVQPAEAEHEAGEGRFVLLETLHEYARERLEERGEGDALRQAHAAYFLALAEDAAPHLHAPDQAPWLGRLEREHGNLRAALGWAQAVEGSPGPPPSAAPLRWAGLRLATALWPFWYTRGYLLEGRTWLEGMLASSQAAPAALRTRALYGASALVNRQGDHGRAAALARDSLALARADGNRQGIADALNMLGNIASDQGDNAQAATCYQESLAVRRALDDTRGIIGALINLGELARVQGDTAAAAGLFEESMAMAQAAGYGRLQAIAANNLGLTAYAQGNKTRAEGLYRAGMAIFEQLGDRWYIAATLTNMAEVALARGDEAAAARLYERSAAAFDAIGDSATAARVRADRANCVPGRPATDS